MTWVDLIFLNSCIIECFLEKLKVCIVTLLTIHDNDMFWRMPNAMPDKSLTWDSSKNKRTPWKLDRQNKMPRKLKDGWRNPIPCFMQAKILVDVNIFFRTQTCKLLLIYQVQQPLHSSPLNSTILQENIFMSWQMKNGINGMTMTYGHELGLRQQLEEIGHVYPVH